MPNLVVRILAQNLTKGGYASALAENRKFDAAISKATRNLGRMGIIAAAGIGVAIAKYAAFDKKIAEIGTLLNNVTEKDIKSMGKEIQDLSVRFGQSLDTMAKAKYDIVSAGFTKSADSAKLLEEASKLAVAGVSEVGGTARLLTKTLNAYGLSVEHAADVSDVMFTTVRLGQTTMEELVGSVGHVASIARAAGLSIADLGSAMATLTAGGLDTQIAAVALRGSLQALAAPTAEGIKGMKKYGIEVKRFEDNTLDLVGTMKQFAGLDLEAIKDIIPDVRAANAVATLGNNIDKLSFAVKEMGKRAGSSQEAFDKMADRVAFKFDQMKTRLAVAAVTIGEKFSGIAEGLTSLVEWFGRLDAPMQTAIVTFGLLTMVIAAFATAITIALGPVGLLYAAAGALGVALTAYVVTSATAEGSTTKLGNASETTASKMGKLQTRLEQLSEHQLEIRISQVGWQMRGLTKEFNDGEIKADVYVAKIRELKLELKAVQSQLETLRTATVDTGDAQATSDAPKIEQRITDWQVFYDSMSESDAAAVDNWVMEQERQMALEAEYAKTRMGMDATLNNAAIDNARKKRIALLKYKLQESEDAAKEAEKQKQIEDMAAANRIAVAQEVLGRISGAFAEHTAIAQAALVIQSMMDTYAAANRALGALPPPFGFIAAAAVYAAGFANVARIRGMSRGGFMEPVRAQTGMVSKGFDSQPAMLRPGEAVIPAEHTRDNMPVIRQLIAGQSVSGSGGGGGGTVQIINNISAIDSQGIADFVNSAEYRDAIIDAINDSNIKLEIGGNRVQGVR